MEIFTEKKIFEIEDYILNFKLNQNNGLFSENDTKIEITSTNSGIKSYINEFWTPKQRQASSIHEISYRACFKPQLPRFFIKILTKEKDIVYDPFSGRGTTVIESGLLNRNIILNDINPLSIILTQPRFFIPDLKDLADRLNEINIYKNDPLDIDLTMFYHSETLNEILSLKKYLSEKEKNNSIDAIDKWIRMVATNRLTGHSPGFFSVYTLPPNQALSQLSQIKINEKKNQKPEYRNTKKIIFDKSKNLVSNLTKNEIHNLKATGEEAVFLNEDARYTKQINSNSVQLTVTSPPFLDIVQYSKDNWLRCWFNNIDEKEIEQKITVSKSLDNWSDVMGKVFKELYRITKENGWVAFEVGEIRKGSIKLDEFVVPLGITAGFECKGILINSQNFTKTSNIWGVNNNEKGTNSNRIVLFYKK